MQRMMARIAAVLVVVLVGGAGHSTAQPGVEARGIAAKIRIEEVVSGHLADLNGKFKLRATEVTFAPDAYLGVHHHVGPGIRDTCRPARSRSRRPARRRPTRPPTTSMKRGTSPIPPLKVIFFEILSADWMGPTVIPPKAY